MNTFASNGSPSCENRRKLLSKHTQFAIALSFIGLSMVTTNAAVGQTVEPVQPPNVLKKLSVEELMNIEVTSVSKRPKSYPRPHRPLNITQEEIQRSGASSLPKHYASLLICKWPRLTRTRGPSRPVGSTERHQTNCWS